MADSRSKYDPGSLYNVENPANTPDVPLLEILTRILSAGNTPQGQLENLNRQLNENKRGRVAKAAGYGSRGFDPKNPEAGPPTTAIHEYGPVGRFFQDLGIRGAPKEEPLSPEEQAGADYGYKLRHDEYYKRLEAAAKRDHMRRTEAYTALSAEGPEIAQQRYPDVFQGTMTKGLGTVQSRGLRAERENFGMASETANRFGPQLGNALLNALNPGGNLGDVFPSDTIGTAQARETAAQRAELSRGETARSNAAREARQRKSDLLARKRAVIARQTSARLARRERSDSRQRMIDNAGKFLHELMSQGKHAQDIVGNPLLHEAEAVEKARKQVKAHPHAVEDAMRLFARSFGQKALEKIVQNLQEAGSVEGKQTGKPLDENVNDILGE